MNDLERQRIEAEMERALGIIETSDQSPREKEINKTLLLWILAQARNGRSLTRAEIDAERSRLQAETPSAENGERS